MPGLVHKITVFATIDGLVLQPVRHHHHHHHRPPSLLIKYLTSEVVSLGSTSRFDVASHDVLEAHGVIGFFEIASIFYVIFISQRRQVAQIRGSPIYVITGVDFIPLTSQCDARNAIIQSIEGLKKESKLQSNRSSASSPTSDDDEDYQEDVVSQDDLIPSLEPSADSTSTASPASSDKLTSIAKDVISRKGEYGRFADKWFSHKGWSTQSMSILGTGTNEDKGVQARDAQAIDSLKPSRRSQIEEETSEGEDNSFEDSNPTQKEVPSNIDKTSLTNNAITPNQKESTANGDEFPSNQAATKLLPKLLRITRLLLCSESFFFSYDYDLSKRLGVLENMDSEIPFYKSIDPLFFWNHYLTRSLIDGGHHAYVLPLIQGYVGQQTFTIKSAPQNPSITMLESQDGITMKQNQTDTSDDQFLITLISRRFITRPGLRYLRRGVDDQGCTANSVETEQLLSKHSWAPHERVHSFTQIRGSIPLFFSQSPYSFKPVPILQHSYEMNHAAFRRHFKSLAARYGALQIASLVDKTSGEAEIGEQYEMHSKQLNDENETNGENVGFEWFDFHEKCRGFHYANISLLMESLRGTMDLFGTTVEADGIVQKKQNGILRTNCMDCLDRTNVAQSAFAQIALQKQLKEEGVMVDLQNDKATQWFNVLWANNGDAISKQYSSTAALKGDYTRTRKRNYRGVINDFGLTLSRYFHNIVNDYFSQAAIDFLAGNVTSQVFDEFELNMMSSDPGISVEKLRANAIDTSSRIVIVDQDEDLIEGWTLLSPYQQNTIRTFPFEETVLLLTNAALYAVRFDWNMEKVSSFERVHLRSLTCISHGTYITSILTSNQTDECRNVGLVITYRPTKEDVTRTNTRSLSHTATCQDMAAYDPEPSSTRLSRGLENFIANRTSRPIPSAPKSLAFKAIAAQSSLPNAGTHVPSEQDLVQSICATIEKAALSAQERDGGGGSGGGVSGFTQQRDIVSLEDARRSTGLLEQWGYALKRMVWA